MQEKHQLLFLDHLCQAIYHACQVGMTAAGVEGAVKFEPAALDADDAAAYLGIGRTKLFELKAGGQIKTVDVGGRPKYLRKDLDRYLSRLEKG